MKEKPKCCWWKTENPPCGKDATVYVYRADAYYCDEHYLDACLHMGCDLKGKPVENN